MKLMILLLGFAAYARSKDHDDQTSLNEGVALVMVNILAPIFLLLLLTS